MWLPYRVSVGVYMRIIKSDVLSSILRLEAEYSPENTYGTLPVGSEVSRDSVKVLN